MQFYNEEYHTGKHKNFVENPEYYRARARLSVKRHLKNLKKDSKILEFGCGMGQNIFLFPNAIGYDISEFALEFCNKKGIKTINDLNKVPDNSISIIFSSHVLEHLENPLENLKLLHKKLAPNGKLILILPEERPDKPLLKPDENQHLYGWNFSTINNLLFRAGFKPIENKFLIWNAGCKKLLPLSRVSFTLYDYATRFLSILIRNHLELKVVAVKSSK